MKKAKEMRNLEGKGMPAITANKDARGYNRALNLRENIIEECCAKDDREVSTHVGGLENPSKERDA